MQSDLKNLLQAHLGQLAGERVTLAAICHWMSAATEERKRLLDEFERRARANPAIETRAGLGPPPRMRARDPIAGA
jgi:hypothetical protein